MSFSRLFHAQRGLWDWDGSGQPVQNERINCKAHYNQSASFDSQLCTWLTGYGNGYGCLGSLSIFSFAFIMAAEYSQHSVRSKKAASYFPLLFTMSTCCFTGRALCQCSFLSSCLLKLSGFFPTCAPMQRLFNRKPQLGTAQGALSLAASWLHGVPTSPRNTGLIQVQMSCNVPPFHTHTSTPSVLNYADLYLFNKEA